RRLAVTAATRRLNDEDVAGTHRDRVRAAETLARAVGALDPVAADRTRLPAGHAVRRLDAMAGENCRGHRLAKAHAADDAVAAALSPCTTGAATNGEAFEQYRETPFQHFRIGQARIRHVGVNRVGPIEIGPGAGAAADRLVILVALIAEGEIVHRALR